MKLAKLGPLNRVLGIQEVEPGVPFTLQHRSLVEVSDEIAQVVLDGAAASPKVFYFFENGELSTVRKRRIPSN
jgi:hypothetical protein